MNAKEYADRRGVSKQAVNQAIEEGRIKAVKKGRVFEIDPEQADRDWAANTLDGVKSSDGINPAVKLKGQKKGSAKKTEPDEPPPEPSPEEQKSARVSASFSSSRAIKEGFNAKLAKLEFEEKAGRLMSKEKAKEAAFKAARLTRDSILGIPDRIAHELAGETDPHKVHTMLTKALVDSLSELTRLNVG